MVNNPFNDTNSTASLNMTMNYTIDWVNGTTKGAVDISPPHPTPNSPVFTLIFVVCLMSLVAICSAAIFLPWLCSCRQRRRLEAQTAAARSLSNSVEASRQAHNKELRYSDIESWVVSRTVLHHDSLCAKLRDIQETENSRLCSKPRTSTMESIDSTVDETVRSDKNESSQCPICFDDLIPGDIASWSLDPDCRHVFHHACIKEWLVKHDDCPFCRATYLPIDDALAKPVDLSAGNSGALQQVNLLMSAHNECLHSCFYCADHGVVYLPSSAPSSFDVHEWQTLQERGECAPTRDALKLLRGNLTIGAGNRTTEEEEGTTDVSIINPIAPISESDLDLEHSGREATSVETCENSIQIESVDEECPSPPSLAEQQYGSTQDQDSD